LVTNDSSDRLEAHYQGKQHQGYLKIRETIDQMRVSCYIACQKNTVIHIFKKLANSSTKSPF
jgi:hypothetical protein